MIRQSKTAKMREVVVTPPLDAAILAMTLTTTGYLFPSGKWTRATIKRYRIKRHKIGGQHFELVGELPPRQYISSRAGDKALRKACDVLGIQGVSTHTFRRSLATHLYDAQIPLRQVMEITGHASLASLTCYLNLEQ